MTLPYPISSSQTDSKSPVDDILADSIRQDLDYLDTATAAIKTFDYEFKINGPLSNYPTGFRRRLDGCLIARAQTFTQARVYMENPGTSGSLVVDVRKYTTPNTPITAIATIYSQATQSITNVAPAKATQSISRLVSQISTQSISRWKSTINVNSIILLGSNLVRYNLASAPDSDWVVGDSVTFASCSNAANNITTTIVRINDDNYPSIVVTNASGVAQTSAAGNAGLNAWAYVYTNPVSTSGFVTGESAIFASHTSSANDGTFAIYAVNSGGNNLVVKNSAGVAQAGVAGTADTSRWVYTFTTSADTTDFTISEKAKMASHSNGANNGNFTIVLVNSGGNNVVVYNTAGVAQGGVAGTVDTNRWIYALPTDPSSDFTAGDYAVITGSTNALNDGSFVVKQVKRSGTNNIVIYNESGVTQAGTNGTVYHSKFKISFASDQSSVYSSTRPSRIEMIGTVSSVWSGNNIYFDVVEVNRGGGSNYNVIVVNTSGVAQASPAGRIMLESRSIFTNKPTLTLATSVTNSTERHMQYDTRSGADLNAEATVLAGDMLAADLVTVPSGAPSDVVIQIV